MSALLTFTLIVGNKVILKNKNISAIIDNNILKFTVEKMLHQINLEDKIFIRENNEYRFILNAEEESCLLELKKEDSTLDILVDKIEFTNNINSCTIEYLIETTDAPMKINLEWEEK